MVVPIQHIETNGYLAYEILLDKNEFGMLDEIEV